MSANPVLDVFAGDSFDSYRRNLHKAGDAESYSLVESGVVCNWHQTPNFDEAKGSTTLLKTQNVMTSDHVTCGITADVMAEDIVFLTDRNGVTGWFRVAGAPTRRNLLPRIKFFITPLGKPPVIV